jgi:DNA polymerase-3 subunit delta'
MAPATSLHTSDAPTFGTLIGQEKAKKLLIRSHGNTRMGHAFLFRGPAGVGKKRAALTFASYINCLAPANNDACGQCQSCLKFKSGNHPDLHIIEPDGAAIKINQIRALKQALAFPPFEARYRVVILIETSTMRREAANSLLKTLEEPPANTLLIMTADTAGELLPTIKSRCQEIPFFALPYDKVAEKLCEIADISREAASTLAAVAEGSLGQALLLLETDLLGTRRAIITALINLQPDNPESVEQVFRIAEDAAALKENLPELLNLLRIWFRDLILYYTNSPDSLIVNLDLLSTFSQAKERWKLEELFDKLGRIKLAEKQLLRNCNKGHVCEMLFFDLL